MTEGIWSKTPLAWLLAMMPALALTILLWTSASADRQGQVQLAVSEAPDEVSLADIVNGSARLGFSPVVGRGLLVTARPGRTIWLRLRMDLAADGGTRYLSLPRQMIEHLRLYQDGPPELILAEAGMELPSKETRWPDSFILPIPDGQQGETTLYIQVQGHGYLNLQPRLISEQQLHRQDSASSGFYDLLYGGLFLIALLALARRLIAGERALRVALAAFVCLLAGLVGNQHLMLTLGGASLAEIPALPSALWVFACGPLIWATQLYAGHEKTNPELVVLHDRAGIAFVALALLMLALPAQFLAKAQMGSFILLIVTSLLCAASLAYDSRQWRWGPILVWLAFAPSLAAVPMVKLQLIPASVLARRGFQLLLAVQLGIYLLLPWIRQAMQARSRSKRGVEVPQSAEEKIAHAREWMIRSLQAGIENSVYDGDMEWIAYRRLMGGLSTVLPQKAAAVIAMNYHNEDLLLCEPKSAEPSFKLLLEQRGSLLKNLSRSMAPQQIGVDFTGPDGLLQHILLAVIPLPIDRPGWGLLVIERRDKDNYSDGELDLCTEFAALATTAADEAAKAMLARRANEIDDESGVYKRELIDQMLERARDQASKKRTPLSLLRIGVDRFEDLTVDMAAFLLPTLADAIRDGVEYGDTVGRFSQDEFLLILPGRSIGEARALAERICAGVAKLTLAVTDETTLRVSVGVSQLQPGERTTQFLLERAAKALGKARQAGGNQVQAIAGAV